MNFLHLSISANIVLAVPVSGTFWGEKCRIRIICVLSAAEKLRYSELRREMCNITDAVLAATLKDLIEDGIIQTVCIRLYQELSFETSVRKQDVTFCR